MPKTSTSHPIELGGAIYRLRVALSMSRQRLACAADIDEWYLLQIERGDRRVGWYKLCDLARALNVTVSGLLREAERLALGDAHQGPFAGYPKIGRGVRQVRRECDMTIVALADCAGMHRTSVSMIERGERQPLWPTLCVLAEALNVRPSRLAEAAEGAGPASNARADTAALGGT
jgi:transcriptional regulator with XRE-family HTH domain